MAVELRGVSLRVGAETHIYETSLALEPGQFNILLGTTLAGKTTLMRLLAGLEKPTTGEVWNIALVNFGTFVGAVCFLLGGYLLWPPSSRCCLSARASRLSLWPSSRTWATIYCLSFPASLSIFW